MGEITIYPTHFEVKPFEPIKYKGLISTLSVWDKRYFKLKLPSYNYDEEEKVLRVPGGFKLDKLKGYFPNYKINDIRSSFFEIKQKNKKIKMKYKPKNDLQTKAIDFLRGSVYSKNAFQKYIAVDTGEGKTFIAVSHIVETGRIPIIFVHKDNLANQWIERITEYTDTSVDEIYQFKGSSKVDKFIKMTKKDKKKYKFLIASYRTFKNYFKDDYSKIDDFVSSNNISLKVFDEAHLEFESLMTMDEYINIPSLYLSATPSRTKYEEDRLYQDVFFNVPKFRGKSKSIKKDHGNYHNVVIVKYESKPSLVFQAEIQKASKDSGFNVGMYSNYLLGEKFETFSSHIKLLVKKLIMNSDGTCKKTLVLVRSIDLVDALRDSFKETNKIKIGTYHSKISAKDKIEAMESDLIFTTDMSMGTGNDIPGLQCIISAVPTSSAVLTQQMLGRLRILEGKEVTYIDLVDMSFSQCKKQLKSREKVYNKFASKISTVEV